jgi:hypothetical protein
MSVSSTVPTGAPRNLSEDEVRSLRETKQAVAAHVLREFTGRTK